ncbi:MAG TPA: carbamoyltransferase C-terminal domain-containing protein [Bryobacteraceae bacterium]|jgi:carbamoyltransferase|nr:carbamoyltransferase C-terminal domain-containing protein [Bryobacteraceae bacterium]
MNILGMNAFHGDASAALLCYGQLTAAVEEERFNRRKHWAGFPAQAAGFCLAGIDPASLGHVAISRDPRAHLWRKLARVAVRPGDWGRLASRVRNTAKVAGLAAHLNSSGIAHADQVRIHHVEHHRAHLASAFFASPFEEAAIVSIDGFGDYSSLMWGVGRGNRFEVRGAVRFPHSLGLFYTAFTQFLGFPKFGDEYKMMGLSAYGEPRYRAQVRDVVAASGGQVRLNLDYFVHHTTGVEMSWDDCEPVCGTVYSPHMVAKFGAPRAAGSEILQRHRDLAASVQAVLEENYFAILNFVQRQTGMRKVCLAGGVALNCVANGMIFEKTDFREVYVQPAAHDAGTAIGAALYVQHQVLNQPRGFVMRHVYYGTEHSDAQVRGALEAAGATYHKLSEEQLLARTAAQIADGKVVGWFQGRMEFGPRALGNRSILADPRRGDMKDVLNSRIKLREPFRPFCPSVPAECAGDFFENDYPSPFMVMAYKIKPAMRAAIPAVVHNDGTGRLQTVEQDVNPLYWKLIRAFGDRTGVPVLLNTSFNENEPIVDTPAQAIDCFLRTRMDVLSIGNYLLLKTENAGVSERRALAAAA